MKLPLGVGSGGYVSVSLPGGRIRRSTLILETWKGLRPKGKVARHLDGNSENDVPENLEWGTQKENCQDTIRHGRSTRGEKNHHSRLTRWEVLEIRERRGDGEMLKAIAEDFEVSEQTICDIVKRRTWGWFR